MKIVVIGGTGLIGSKVVENLGARGHQVIAAAPSTGVDVLTGKGLSSALAGAQVVVDLSNPPSFDDESVRHFFKTAGANLFAAEADAGVRNHVALSVVGTEKLEASGYFRGKIAQEQLIVDSGIPYTIVRSTQFFEFLPRMIQNAEDGESVRMSPALVQPIASEDVATAVARATLEAPVNGIIEIAGPEREPLDDLARRFMSLTGDPREVLTDAHAPYFGAELDRDTLIPESSAWLGTVSFERWLGRSKYVPADLPRATAPFCRP